MKFQRKVGFTGSRYVKYRNRRIYDRKESRYVTQQDMLGELEGGARVCMDKTDVDITRQILLDIFHQKEQRAPTLSEEAILNLIRVKP